MSTYKIHNRSVNRYHCPIVEASKFLADFWNMWILRILFTGPKKFSEIQTDICTINRVTLVNKLKVLIDAGFVTKSLNEELKPQYELSAMGKKIKPMIHELEKFAEKEFSTKLGDADPEDFTLDIFK